MIITNIDLSILIAIGFVMAITFMSLGLVLFYLIEKIVGKLNRKYIPLTHHEQLRLFNADGDQELLRSLLKKKVTKIPRRFGCVVNNWDRTAKVWVSIF